MCPITLNVKEARKETAKQNLVLLSHLLQNILCWVKHCIDKEGVGMGGKKSAVLSQPPTTVQRKSKCDCCYIQQCCKRFTVHISGSSMSNYSINQACFSSAHPEADQGICQEGLSKARINLHKCN